MKKIILYIVAFTVLLITGCYRDEILPYKPGEAIQPVENLQYTIAGTEVMLTWSLPPSYADEIIQPVAVQVRISVDGQNAGTHVIGNAPESYTYSSYDPQRKYRFTVKVVGDVDTQEAHVSNLRYSLGQTVAF